MNTDRVLNFQSYFAAATTIELYESIKQEAEKLTQREQLQLVNEAIAARFRIEGGAQ